MQKGCRHMDIIWTKFNRMVDCSKVSCVSCLNAQSNHIGRMKKHYEKCVKQPRSSESQPSTGSESQRDVVCDPAPVPVSQLTPAQQAKHPAALQFGPDPPPVVQTPAATKDDLDDRLLSSYMGAACHSASLNTPSSSSWCPVFVQVIRHLPEQ